MDCGTAKEWMATAVAEDLQPPETLVAHLSGCPNCRAVHEEWRQTWALLTSWADEEPPACLDRVVLGEVRARRETTPSWLRRLASGRVWAVAAGAAVLAVMVSLLLQYQDAFRLCGKALTDAGLAAPVILVSFLVGAIYALLPVVVTVTPWMLLRGDMSKVRGTTVGEAFAVIMVPYVLVTCVGLEATVIAGILMGTVTGALGGGAVSHWLIRHQHTGVPV